jgi:Xaa-Pro aminopeptidase
MAASSSGCLSHAYDPIVAYGANACTLHYTKNSDVLRGKNFLLMDVGASVDGYASDITRTYAYKEPTKRQAAVHQAVQEAQQQIIALLGPDVDVACYQTQVDEIMLEALRSLNLVGSDPHKSLRRYMPHAVSHGLGLDVHDSLGGPAAFAPSMVLTVEPGIYIPEESIGVRIEDDIVITDSGRKNLSQKLPISW